MPVRASLAILFFGLVLLLTFVFHWQTRRRQPGRSLSVVLLSAGVFDALSHVLALSLAPRPEDVVRALPMSLPLLFCWGLGFVVLMDLVLRAMQKRG